MLIIKIIMGGEQIGIWEKPAVVYSKVLTRNLPGETEENNENDGLDRR
jgi:hypothetical protein